MSARKSGTSILVEGTGNTLTSVTSDIADTSFIEETSSGVFVVHGAHTLDIRTGGELTIGSEADYSVREELHFNPTTHAFYGFYQRSGGMFRMFGNSVLNLSYVAGKGVYPIWWGSLYWRGSDAVLGSELLTDGDMELSDTSAWTANNSATLSKELDSTNKVLRVAYNGVANPGALQNVVTSGVSYYVSGKVRSDGTARPLINVGGGGTVHWYGTRNTAWQSFSFQVTADGSSGVVFTSETSSTSYTEWDDVNVKEVVTPAYRPLYKGFTNSFLYDGVGSQYPDDKWDIEKIDLGWGYQGSGGSLSAGTAFSGTSLYATSRSRTHRFVDIGVNWEGVEPPQYGFYDMFQWTGPNQYDFSALWTIDKIKLDRVGRMLYSSHACMPKIQNSQFSRSWISISCIGESRGQPVYQEVEISGSPALPQTFGQHFYLFENCEFRDGYQSSSTDRSGIAASYGGVHVLFKNCMFTYRAATPASANVVISSWDAHIWWLGNTGNFLDTNCTMTPLNYSSIYYAFMLDLTVVDIGGNPIEGAQVIVRQCDGKETYHFTTDSTGKPRTLGCLAGKIVLANYEATQFRWDTQENFTVQGVKWSDPSNDTYHEIIVVKRGYGTFIGRVVMNQDRDLTIALTGYNMLGQ